MPTLRTIYDDLPELIVIPPIYRHKKVELILIELDSEDTVSLSNKLDFQKFSQKWAGILKEDINYKSERLDRLERKHS